METSVDVRVGVGVLIARADGRVLLGLRKGAHGSGTWALPGGHLEPGESIADCAVREVAEETGLVVADVRHLGFTANVFSEVDRHYVTLFVQATAADSAQVENLEPDKCEGWEWHAWDALPEPLFPPLRSLAEQGVRPVTGVSASP